MADEPNAPRQLLKRTAALAVVLALVLADGSRNTALREADFFNGEVLQRVDLQFGAGDWESLKTNFRENTYFPADLTWHGHTVPRVGVRSRGSGSRSGAKPGLLVDVNRFTTGQTFLGLESVILDNLTQDASGVRETVAMRFFGRLNIPAPREAHTRLYVNGQYAGLYAIVEDVDEGLLNRVFGGTEGRPRDAGYLFEFNYIPGAPWRFEHLGPKLEPYKDRFDVKGKRGRTDDQIWGPLEALTRLATETPPEGFADTIKEHLDVDALVRYAAAQNFVAQHDGLLGYAGANNFYLYRREGGSHLFIAWDEDNAFASPAYPLDARHDENVVMHKLMAQADQRLKYYDLLRAAAAAAAEPTPDRPEGWLRGEIRRQLDLIARAAYDDSHSPFSSNEQLAAHEAMLAFADARIRYVTVNLSSGHP